MEDHEAAHAHPSCGLVEAERWWSGASSVSLGGTTMVERQARVPCSAWWKENEGMNGAGGGVGQARRGGKENGARRAVAAREHRRGALVRRCPAPFGSRGVGSARVHGPASGRNDLGLV
jgi:hypothetical protein